MINNWLKLRFRRSKGVEIAENMVYVKRMLKK